MLFRFILNNNNKVIDKFENPIIFFQSKKKRGKS